MWVCGTSVSADYGGEPVTVGQRALPFLPGLLLPRMHFLGNVCDAPKLASSRWLLAPHNSSGPRSSMTVFFPPLWDLTSIFSAF